MIADTGSPLRPGLFQGSVDAVEAWAKYINANGGLACRQVVVKAADSKLTEDDAQNAVTTACGNSLAMVGTTALFLDNMSRPSSARTRPAQPVGIPDLAVIQTLRGGAVLADLVRGTAVGAVVPLQRHAACARSRRRRSPRTTT